MPTRPRSEAEQVPLGYRPVNIRQHSIRRGGMWASRPTVGQGHFLHVRRSKRLSGLEAEAMLHLDDVLKEEIYARGACSWGQYQRVEGSCGAEAPKSAWGSARGRV